MNPLSHLHSWPHYPRHIYRQPNASEKGSGGAEVVSQKEEDLKDWLKNSADAVGEAFDKTLASAQKKLDKGLKHANQALKEGMGVLEPSTAEHFATDLQRFIKKDGIDLVDNIYSLLNKNPNVTEHDLREALADSGFGASEFLLNSTLILMLQKWANKYHGMGIEEDGRLGPETLSALGASFNQIKGYDFNESELKEINDQFKGWKGLGATERDLRGLWKFSLKLKGFSISEDMPYLVTEYIKYYPESVGQTREQMSPGKFEPVTLANGRFSEESLAAIETDLGELLTDEEEIRLVELSQRYERIWNKPPTVGEMTFRYLNGDLNLLLPGDIEEAKQEAKRKKVDVQQLLS